MPRLALVIELHHPLPPPRSAVESTWATAVFDAHLPVLHALDRFAEHPGDASLTLAVSPSWTALSAHPASERLVKREFERRKAAGAVESGLARFFESRWESGGALGLLRSWNDAGAIDVIPTTATHTWLPSVADDPVIARAQIGLAAADHQRWSGRPPSGIWLPFLGYAPGIESTMAESGLRFFGVSAHDFERGEFSPPRGVFEPLITPPGVAAVGVVDASFSPAFGADRAHDPDPRDANPNPNPDADPDLAARAVREHAQRFLGECLERVSSGASDRETARESLGVVSFTPHDLARAWPLGGGGEWLAQTLLELSSLKDAGATSLDRYLDRNPVGLVGRPGASAGGMLAARPADSDLFDRCRAAADLLTFALERRRSLRPAERDVLARMVRRLLRAQQVDWSIVPGGGVDPHVGLQRAGESLDRFYELAAALMGGRVESTAPPPWPGPSFLPDLDLEILAG